MKQTRDLFVPFIDTNKSTDGAGYQWVPIDLSTVFELSYNPQTETYSYICDANDSTEITSYQVAMDQEIALESENKLYKFMFDFMRSMPVGSAAKVPVMITYPNKETGKTTEADVWDDAVISPGVLNTVDGKLTFTLQLNGAPKKGTVTISEGTATFSGSDAS